MKCPICSKEQENVFEHLRVWHQVDDNPGAHKSTVDSVTMFESILELLALKEYNNRYFKDG